MPSDSHKLFRTTSDDTGNIGRPGHDTERTWQKFYAKYRNSCITFLQHDYPQWANEAEDVFQRVALLIHGNPNITNRKPNDRFRTILCNLCTREMTRLHHPARETAKKRFASFSPSYLLGLLHPSRPRGDRSRAMLEDIVLFICEDMMDADYENGRYFKELDERQLGIWRLIQRTESRRPAEAVRKFGIERNEAYRAFTVINKWIRSHARQIADEIHYLD